MTDNKFIIVIVFALTALIAVSYSLRSVEKIKPAPVTALPQANFTQLESQMQQLKDLVNTFTQFNLSLQKSLNEEKEKALEVKEKTLDLQEKLKDAVAKKETLAGELTKAKENLELTQPIKEKLAQIEEALSKLEFSPDKESQLFQQLENLGKDLDSINQQMPSLANENNTYKIQVQALSELLSKKEQELSNFRHQTEENRIKNYALEKNLDTISVELTNVAEEKAHIEKKAEEAKQATQVQKLQQELRLAEAREARLSQEKQLALEEVDKYKKGLALLTRKNQEMSKEISSLKANLERLNKDYSSLKSEHETTQLAIKQSEAELNKHKETITYMKERLEEADAKAFEIYSKYKELKKDAALLREQNVDVQIEKEGLTDELHQKQTKLNELQNKFQKIGTMIEDEAEPASRIVDVELLPQGEQPKINNDK